MIRRILHYGEEQLRQESRPVSEITDEIRELVRDMFESMYKAQGIGLAAPQVGVSFRLFILDLGEKKMVFINPKIIDKDGKETFEEGCLSFPGLREKVQRSRRVIATAIGLDGKEFEVTAEGLFARAIQHEYDHLEGVLMVDRISKARRIQLKRDLERLANGETLNQEVET